ncbi:DUF2690 domain-containing protein [Flavimobilis sp. GY10621]|uniref:DUF2690 domain-containing protein n=1 Tax=Flavimobilis rhizosphaerae TaxID=2775421 RepID=A0ABR9DNR7_9MICO|nr:DUF2690 domain-containing protein [Flavimobilis rhizosphaerae]MBD9698751.1 DUF2690 domain-containing protein [Flavimobilis rhizosphaerae]
MNETTADDANTVPDGAGLSSVEEFAAALSELRTAAGRPTLVALERRTGVSKTVLSDAFAGRRLPTERTVEAIASVLDADVAEWTRRRRELEESLRPQAVVGAGAPAYPVVRRRSALLAAAGAFVLGVVGTAGVVAALPDEVPDASGRGAPAAATALVTPMESPAEILVEVGTDPATTPCVDDAKVVASVTRARDTQLQIVYSNACQAAWARVTRYDDEAAGNAVGASIFRQIAPDASDRQDTHEPDAQGAYTTLIVRPTSATRVCAVGYITLDGEKIDLGDQICV